MNHIAARSLSFWLWDLWCACSLVGIWPRFIEPRLLEINYLDLSFSRLPEELEGIRIVQFSDLHLNSFTSRQFLKKISRKVLELHPHIILFTGDFISSSQLLDKDSLRLFLKSFHAPHGCYAILGNHDYENYVSITAEGHYGIVSPKKSEFKKGWFRLFNQVDLTKKVLPEAQQTPFHAELFHLLKESPFQLLHNETRLIPFKSSFLNICGLGEYTLGRCNPKKAFENYDQRYPGIIMTHNPDSVDLLKDFPGELILSGHTHGCQVNLPFLRKKCLRMEHMDRYRGLLQLDKKWLYVNRGVGSTLPFRWRSRPELLLITLTKGKSI